MRNWIWIPVLIIGAFLVGVLIAGGKPSVFKFGLRETEQVDLSAGAPASPAGRLAQAGSPEKFAYLSKQHSNSCGLQATTVLSYSDEQRLQGSCCSAMDLHRYQEQVEGLKKFATISQIPKDPYDIPVSLVKELLGYKNNIELLAVQQAIYNQAMKLSREGGPCCCKCWRWDAFEGQAKFLITKYNFNAQQIAEIWDIEDGCGGEHEHG